MRSMIFYRSTKATHRKRNAFPYDRSPDLQMLSKFCQAGEDFIRRIRTDTKITATANATNHEPQRCELKEVIRSMQAQPFAFSHNSAAVPTSVTRPEYNAAVICLFRLLCSHPSHIARLANHKPLEWETSKHPNRKLSIGITKRAGYRSRFDVFSASFDPRVRSGPSPDSRPRHRQTRVGAVLPFAAELIATRPDALQRRPCACS